MTGKAESYLRTINFRLYKYILPELGLFSIKDIKAPDVLRLCRKIENTGHEETARRVKTIIGQIFRFAIASGWAENDPTSVLIGALAPRNNKHYATLTDPSEIAILMRAIKVLQYQLQTRDPKVQNRGEKHSCPVHESPNLAAACILHSLSILRL